MTEQAKLKPLLMPSGPQWSEKWTDRYPPPLVRYDGYRYRSRWVDSAVDRHDSWPNGAWLLEGDRGTRLGRLWWKRSVVGLVMALRLVGARRTALRLEDRSDAYPFGRARRCRGASRSAPT